MPSAGRLQKPGLPVLNRNRSLYQGLQFAICAGWQHGFQGDGGLGDAARDDVKQQRGIWIGSLDSDNYPWPIAGSTLHQQSQAGGAQWNAGGGSVDRLGYTDTADMFDLPNGQVSACILFQPEAVLNNEEAAWSKQSGPAPNDGWGITASATLSGDPNPNGWHVQVNNGAIIEISAANTQDTTRLQLVTLTFDRTTINQFIDGAFTATSSGAAGNIVNNNNDLRAFGDAVQPNFDGYMAAAMVWTRQLSQVEISELVADPYMIWKASLLEYAAYTEFGGAGYQTYLGVF
jgi:hypothetical protein